MRLSSSAPGSSLRHRNVGKSGSWLRKKRKRLDAICEDEYNRNHGELNECEDASGTGVRRSSRVRRAPVVLDASPAPPKKRQRFGKNRMPAGRVKGFKETIEQGGRNSGGGDAESPGTWSSRLRSRSSRNVGFRVKEEKESRRGKRKLFKAEVGSRDDRELEVDEKEELEGGTPRIVKSKRPGRIKAKKHEEELKENESHDEGHKENESYEEGHEESESHEEGHEESESHEKGHEESESDQEGHEESESDQEGHEESDSSKEGHEESESCEEGQGESESCEEGNGESESHEGHKENESHQEHRENECHGSLDESKNQIVDHMLHKDEDSSLVLEIDESSRNLVDLLDEKGPSVVANGETNTSSKLQAEECSGGIEKSLVENVEKQDDQLECVKEGNNGSNAIEIAGVSKKQLENEGSVDKEVEIDEIALTDANIVTKDATKQASNGTAGHQRIKEGRRCGLCGGGTDGKPPKLLLQDNGESENEAYSGSSASEEPNYDIWDGFSDECGWLGHLLGPINDNYGIARIWVHQQCAVWSPEVYFAGLGCLKNVRAALCRGRALKCTRCGRRGATSGCRVDRCPKTYHLPCARASGCIFDHRKFLIACTDHRHLFEPHGNKYSARIKKLRARKMKWEMRKHSNEAWRKDIAAEERWLENCGEDEEFLKRENKRLHRDLLRIAPVYIGGPDSASESSIQGWESVAGLKDVIQCMKEVVILPLLYPQLFDNLGLTPPRGILLHGYPGTGKTLVVRALIGACARGDKRIAYFARKGADCLGKYVGDAERQLRLLFQVAEKCQPSIIFFDEIDGLAPCRTRQQDQTHSSVVSTLLALMDGLKSRGSVVVIGATNRPEAVDPALRRPGRFDREIYFPLPSIEDRASILSLHTQRWPKPITGSLLDWIARKTPGYAGADLQALCTQAAINALKRNFPLQEVLSLAEEKHFGWKHLPLPSFAVEERDWLEAFSRSPLPCSRREAGNAANDVASSPLPIHLIPCLLRPLCSLLISLCLDELPWLPPPLFKAVTVLKNEMVSALEKRRMPIDHWWLHVDDFLKETDIAFEVRSKLACLGILSANNGFAGSPDIMDDKYDSKVKFEPSIKNLAGMRRGLFPNKSFAFTNKSGFRILISGNPQSGQRHLASCVLHSFMGNIEMQKIDMATMSQEGHGDVVQGIAQKLMRCASVQLCVLFMPRIDLWAVDKHFQASEKIDSFSTSHLLPEVDKSLEASQVVGKKSEFNIEKNSAEITKGQAKASHAWMSFIEQVESIGVSTSLMVLATSEVPYSELPRKIREFFKSYQSKDSQSTLLEQNVPRFSLQLDGNFDREAMISLSVRELLRNVVEQQIQLVHRRSHIHMDAQKGLRTFESMQLCKDNVCQSKDDGSADEKKSEIQLPKSLTKVSSPPNSRSLKDKSTLLSAISTFGCQILLYPHFAELCWATSKLKEGPCTDVIGSWRSWPFNSCVIRPTSNSQDKVVVSCSSGSIKSKERSGVVRGLIAVGLLAYRGVYKSAREVSHDVRKVLEILIEKINAKVQAGKDRYQYLRISSQAAYLEDTVNNWAYSLPSLEQDSLELVLKVTPPSHPSCEDHQAGGEDCPLVVPMDCDDSENRETNFEEIPAETTGSPALNEKNDNIDNLDCDGEGSLQNHSADKHSNNSLDANQPVDPSLNQENGNPAGGVSESVTAGNHVSAGGEVGVSEDMNNSKHTAVLSENGLDTTGELEGDESNNPSTVSNQPLSMSSADTGVKLSDVNSDKPENPMDINVSPDNGSDTAEPCVICTYRCCPGCLHSLYDVMHKLLTRELSNSLWTVEDVHDAVSSLSVDLISAVRKCHMEKGFSDLCSKTFRHEQHANMETCDPGNRGKDIFVPGECVCSTHSTTDKVLNESQKLDLKFIFKDGVLVPVDPDKDFPLHCKFENLCLCSVTELIVVTKRPFD